MSDDRDTRRGIGEAADPGTAHTVSSESQPLVEAAPGPLEEVYGGFRLIEKIAEGGMGVIYRAEHVKIGKRAAVKIIKPAFCENPELIRRFYQEARAVNAIGHENIVDIFDFGTDGAGRAFFVMELLEGEPLSQRLQRGAMRWSEGRPILEQTMRALAAAHQAGFVHRDIKPENIFLRRRAERTAVKLLDFGITKLTGEAGAAARITRTGEVFGTPAYMAPEQIEGLEVDRRADIYSLGVIVYEMFAGRPPFDGETLGSLIKQHLFAAPAPLAPHPAVGAPPGLEAVVAKMLAKAPEQRYASIAELESDLAEIERHRPPSIASRAAPQLPTPLSVPVPAPASTETAVAAPARRRRTRWPLALLAVAGVAGAGVGGAALHAALTAEDGARPTAAATAADAAPTPASSIDVGAVRDRSRSLLRGALEAAEPAVRRDGADALAAVRDRKSNPKLLGVLDDDPDLEVRGHAAVALGALGGDSEKAAIAKLYQEAPPELRVWLDQALLALGERRARRRLEAASKESDLAVSFKAALALADASASGDERAIDALERLAAREAELSDVAPYAGIVILTKLAALHQGRARRALLEALTRPEESARLAAAEGLARLGDPVARDPLRAILGDSSSPNRLVAGRALVFLGDYGGFDVLSEALGDADPARRREAAGGLAAIGERDSLAPLAGLLEDDDPRVRVAGAAAILSILGLDPALLAAASLDWAKSAIDSQDWATRLAAARTIGDIPTDQAMPLFAAAVLDRQPEVRKAAAHTARHLRGARPARLLARAARAEKDAAVKEEQVRSLAAMAQPATRDALAEMASDKDRVGVLAAGALLAVGEAGAVTTLERAMRSRHLELRLAAAESAAISKDPITIPTLVLGLDDKSFRVRFSAAEGLSLFDAEKDRALAILGRGLEGSEPLVVARAHAAYLRFHETPSAGPTPQQLFDSADRDSRLAALVAVPAMRWDEAEGIIRRAVRDRDPEIRRRAVDLLVDRARGHRDAVVAMYRSLSRDRDPTIRVKAQAQLARLTATRTAAAPPPKPADDLAELRAAAARVADARGDLETVQRALEEVVGEIDAATARAATDDAQVERVEKLAATVQERADKVIAVRRDFQQAVRRGVELGQTLRSDEARGLLARIEAQGREGAAIARAAVAAGADARKRAERFAADETADPDVYLTTATTAIAAGKLGQARRDLRRAEKLFGARGKKPPADLWFAYGELNARLAQKSGDRDRRLGYLQKAKRSYDRFAARGAGFRVKQARERSAQLATEIANMLAE